jgi:hypothetical protein
MKRAATRLATEQWVTMPRAQRDFER